jgi:SAM-dependent methyltransferase
MMPTNDIHSHRCRSEQSFRAVLSLVVPRRSLCSRTTFPTDSAAGVHVGDWGAIVTCFDFSAKMVELPRHRLGPDTDLHVADLTNPLPFRDGAFDDVVASLVLHYLQDWAAPLAEMHPVLRSGGRLIMSVNHLIIDKLTNPEADYFATLK